MKKITGAGTMGDYKTRPLTFKNTSIVINGSYYEIKLELLGNKEDTEIILEFYDTFINYGEGGEDLFKPICGMMLETENKYFKKKTYMSKEEIINFLHNQHFSKITIFFETTIQESPLNFDYLSSNSYGISCIGGLYYIADKYLYIEINEEIIEQEIYQNNKSCFQVENYMEEDMYEYALETAKTAKELFKHSNKGEQFKFNGYINF